jgi:hypothetical protein
MVVFRHAGRMVSEILAPQAIITNIYSEVPCVVCSHLKSPRGERGACSRRKRRAQGRAAAPEPARFMETKKFSFFNAIIY